MKEIQISLPQILAARENRARAQQALLAKHGCPIVSFTMNIAGPVKDSPLIRRGFFEGIAQLEDSLSPEVILEGTIEHSATGSAALYAVNMDSQVLKDICVRIEEESALGRLFDMDVLDTCGSKLERSGSRGCIICGAPGRHCASRRLHSIPALQKATQNILEFYFVQHDADAIADAAVQSLLDEVNATPKPGLVDRRNNGSHQDMDLALFTASAQALRPYFRKCFTIGRTSDIPFPMLRKAGLQAERIMYHTTNGVNTHKGAIFTLGLLCSSIGHLWSAAAPAPRWEDVLDYCSLMVAPTLHHELITAAGVTAGEQLYQLYGLTGARGEAATGFPSIRRALPFYLQQLEDTDQEAALIHTLLFLITHVEDTNLYHRGGPEGTQWARQAAAALLSNPTSSQLEALDDEFIARNLSPGGCADLLAAVIFLSSCCQTSIHPKK